MDKQKLREFELRVMESNFRELKLWKEIPGNQSALFTIAKGTAGSTERWEMWTPKTSHYGDSAKEVLDQAAKDYPDIWNWLDEFNDE